MKAQENVITLISALVATMTPVVTITANVADGDNWKLSMCNTYWINTGTTLTIGGASFEVVSFLRNDHIIVSGAAQPVGTWFQLSAPSFWYGSRRKVDNERVGEPDMTTPMVYLPPFESVHPNLGDSEYAYTADLRPVFLMEYDERKDEIALQQTELIEPLHAMADFFVSLINDNTTTYEESDEFTKKDWPNFGDPDAWGNDELIFNQPLSGVELRITVNVYPSDACPCDGAPVQTCAPVNVYLNSVLYQVVPSGGDIDIITGSGSPVTSSYNGTSLVDTPAGENKAIVGRNSDLTPVGSITTNDANNLVVDVDDVTIDNSDVSYTVDVPAEGNFVLPDITITDSDGSPVVWPAVKNFTCTPATPFVNTSNFYKDGQITSYTTGDDPTEGRGTDWWNLGYNNGFGNGKRFTGITGGYEDELSPGSYYDKDGNPTTYALAFPSDIMLDWAQWQNTVGVYGWYMFWSAAGNWTASQAAAIASTQGGYSGWNMPKKNTLSGIYLDENGGGAPIGLNYVPIKLDLNAAGTRIWTRTTGGITSRAYALINNGNLQGLNKTDTTWNYMIVRLFTYAELGL